jgi:hypothetical protein
VSATVLVTGAIGAGVVPWLVWAARAWVNEPTPAPAAPAGAPGPGVPAGGPAAGPDWRVLHARGLLRPVSPVVADPHTPGVCLVVVEDVTGALGGRVLMATSTAGAVGGSRTVAGVVVPAWVSDPLQAAAAFGGAR